MKKLLCLFLMLIPVVTFAQEKGIKFEHGLTWEQIKAKAKKENKYIFIDGFTTWCGPCKYMAASIFPLETVGDYFNSRFISVKLQLDKTPQDNEDVKSWYTTAEELGKAYSISAFPTFVFLDPNGEPVHRLVGSSDDGESWLQRVAKTFDPEQQYYTVRKKFENGNREPAFLRTAAISARQAQDRQVVDSLKNAYIRTQTDWSTPGNIEFAATFMEASIDPWFRVFLEQPAKVNAVLGEGQAQKMVKEVILIEEVSLRLWENGKRNPNVNWETINARLQQYYPAYAGEVLALGKLSYYQALKEWDKYATTVVQYIKQYGANMSAYDLNEYAWKVFLHCKDAACVTEALGWSRRSFKDTEAPNHIDTYANILYKLGRKKEAIGWQEKAVAYTKDPGQKKDFQATLGKMKKGEKTWKE